jgi:hypothetical protein
MVSPQFGTSLTQDQLEREVVGTPIRGKSSVIRAFRNASPALLAALAVTLSAGTPASADERAGRFTMTPANGGFIRLDTVTGAVSFCKGQDPAQWSCTLMPDGQQSMQKQIDDLKAENQTLKDELKRMEDVFVHGGKPGETRPGEAHPGGDGRPGGGGKMELPSEQDVDKAFDYLEKMMKKFRDRMHRMEKPDEPEKPGKSL